VKTSSLQNLNLRFLGLTIKVSVEQFNDIVWLKEFLLPQFEVVDGDHFDCEILLDINDDYFSDLKANRHSPNGEVNGFILDTKIVKLSCWQDHAGWRIFYDCELNVFYCLSSDKNRVTIIAHSRKSIGYRTALMRVIREYAENHARCYPGCMMHGGAFSYQGKGVIIAGVKNTGKTSTLTYFLHNYPVKYITNDRLYIRMTEGSAMICQHDSLTIFVSRINPFTSPLGLCLFAFKS